MRLRRRRRSWCLASCERTCRRPARTGAPFYGCRTRAPLPGPTTGRAALGRCPVWVSFLKNHHPLEIKQSTVNVRVHMRTRMCDCSKAHKRKRDVDVAAPKEAGLPASRGDALGLHMHGHSRWTAVGLDSFDIDVHVHVHVRMRMPRICIIHWCM